QRNIVHHRATARVEQATGGQIVARIVPVTAARIVARTAAQTVVAIVSILADVAAGDALAAAAAVVGEVAAAVAASVRALGAIFLPQNTLRLRAKIALATEAIAAIRIVVRRIAGHGGI